MIGDYEIIVRDNDRELAESVRVANLYGSIALGSLIVDQDRVLQVVRHVRDGYVTADGKPRGAEAINDFLTEAPKK